MQYITEDEAEQRYNDYIDEVTGDIVILGMSYCASTVLKEIDPIAYDCCYSDWLDSENLTTTETEADDYNDEEE